MERPAPPAAITTEPGAPEGAPAAEARAARGDGPWLALLLGLAALLLVCAALVLAASGGAAAPAA